MSRGAQEKHTTMRLNDNDLTLIDLYTSTREEAREPTLDELMRDGAFHDDLDSLRLDTTVVYEDLS
jgi:hypothetical protein